MSKLICYPHPAPEHGGPGSFQTRFTAALSADGIESTVLSFRARPDAILIVGGTRRLIMVSFWKLLGVPVLYRLDGINYVHRLQPTPPERWLLAEMRNLLMVLIIKYLADAVVYQSKYVRETWERRGLTGRARIERVIYNGYSPARQYEKCTDRSGEQGPLRVVCVEGAINGRPAVEILCSVAYCSVSVYGKCEVKYAAEIERRTGGNVRMLGLISRDEVPNVYVGKVAFLLLETNPPCPNSVIEALAHGCPVVAFRSGSIEELVDESSGIILDYGASPDLLQAPNTHKLDWALATIEQNYETYSKGARERARKLFSAQEMYRQYLSVIEELTTGTDRH
jgi:glycosyltransferase involved in cell wall biosynthesis